MPLPTLLELLHVVGQWLWERRGMGPSLRTAGDFSLVKCGRKWGNWGRLIWI